MFVVVDKEAFVFGLFIGVLRVVDQQKYMHYYPNGQHEGQVQDRVVDCAGKDDVLVIVLES